MDGIAFSTVVSGALAIIVAALSSGLTYVFTRRRERESDWRKMKLEHYEDYVMALSGIVEGRDTPDRHDRYVDAVNGLTLVASADALRALYAYLDYMSYRNATKTQQRHDELLTELLRALRRDVDPTHRRDDDAVVFRLITVPPDMRSSGQSLQKD